FTFHITLTTRVLSSSPRYPLARRAPRALRVPRCFPTRRSSDLVDAEVVQDPVSGGDLGGSAVDHDELRRVGELARLARIGVDRRSEEHTSQLQSRGNLVCRLLLEKKQCLSTAIST